MTTRPLLRLAALASLLAAPPRASADELFNPTPVNCCDCIEITVNGRKNVNMPDKAPLRIDGNCDGTYTFKLDVNVVPKTGFDCSNVKITNITLVPVTLEGPPGTIAADHAFPAGEPGIDAYHGSVTLSGFASHDVWMVEVSCSDTATGTEGETQYPALRCKYPITIGSRCSSCSSGAPGSCDPSGSINGGFTYNIPAGQASAGDTSGELEFFTPDFSFPGLAGLYANVPSAYPVVRTDTSLVVTTPTTVISAAPSTVGSTTSITINHTHASDTPPATPFRTTIISIVTDTDTWLRADSTFEGTTTRYQWKTTPPSGGVTSHTLQSGSYPSDGGSFTCLREESLKITPDTAAGTETHVETITESELVSKIKSIWTNYPWGWEKTEEHIDPDNANLTSTWSYYAGEEGTTPEGFGRLKHHTRYDGHEETHTYLFAGGASLHVTMLPFASASQGLTLTRAWNSAANTLTTTSEADSNTISKETETYDATPSAPSISTNVETADGKSLTTTTKLMPFLADFGGQPLSVAHPDGTTTTYTYAYSRDDSVPPKIIGKSVIVRNGIIAADSVTNGTTTTTGYNAFGTAVLGTSDLTVPVAGTITTDSYEVPSTQQDSFGRALITTHFSGAYTTAATYSCCGLATSTDMHGVQTDYEYDGLRRQTKATNTTLGITTETVYSGLTTSTYRYPTAGGAADLVGGTNRISRTTRNNLAGTSTTTESPDPSAIGTSGALTPTLSETAYAGTLTTTKTTVGTAIQLTTSYPDGRTYQTAGDLALGMQYDYTVNISGLLTTQSYLDGASIATGAIVGTPTEASTTQTDRAGRTTQTIKGTTAVYTYDPTSGQLLSVGDSDPVDPAITLYGYNAIGERTTTAFKLDALTTITYGTDQVTRTETFPHTRTGGIDVIRTETCVWQDGDTSANGTLAAYTERTPAGLDTWSWRIDAGETHTAATVGPDRTETTTRPDGTYSVTTYAGGLPDTTVLYTAGSGPTSIVTSAMRDASGDVGSGYDTLKRPTATTDSRTGTTTTAYISATCDAVLSVSAPGTRITSFTYDSRGNRLSVHAPETRDATGAILHNITNTAYNPDGSVLSVSGDQAYPVSYTYDYAGRMKTMTTSGASPNNAITTWNYYASTGLLKEKLDNSGSGPLYVYTDSGRLHTRTWARVVSATNHNQVATTYGYTHGLPTSVTYNDGTPNVAIVRDCLGRVKSLTQSVQVTVSGVSVTRYPSKIEYTYAADLAVDKETMTYDLNLDGTPELTRVLDRADRDLGRDKGWQLIKNGTTIENRVTYGYSATTGLLETVANAADTFTYGYRYTQASGGPRVGATTGTTNPDIIPYTLTKNGTPTLQTIRTYDATRDALTVIENSSGTTVRSRYSYSVNDLGQRTGLTSAFNLVNTSHSGNTIWGYDYLGQLTTADAPPTTYFPTDRKYTYDTIGNRQQSSTGTFTTTGGTTTFATDTLTQYFGAAGGSPPAGANALNQYVGVKTGGAATVQTTYDLDGNMQAGPLPSSPATAGSLVWDAENRLIEATCAGNTVDFKYDALSRRIWRSTGTTAFSLYIYDGWNLIAEYTGSSPALDQTYLWGLDQSGTLQGAGGVGGLLAVGIATGSDAGSYYPTYDGNGNVSEYLAGGGGDVAHFEWDPFGEQTSYSSSIGTTFPFGFSTKQRETYTGLIYYGFRYYDPHTGRWPSKDPIEEDGGANLYGFVGNDGVDRWDELGLRQWFGLAGNWTKMTTNEDKSRRYWSRKDKTVSMKLLADNVKLNPEESDKWAKAEDPSKCGLKKENKGCCYSVPRIYIVADTLRGKTFGDRFINVGGTVGNIFTQGDFEKVTVKSGSSVVSEINKYKGKIWGFAIFAHGLPNGNLYESRAAGTPSYANNSDVISALQGNGFQLANLFAMHCYSGYVGNYHGGTYDWAPKWNKLYHNRGRTFQFVNAALGDVNVQGLDRVTGLTNDDRKELGNAKH